MNLRDVTAAAAEFGPLPDALSDEPATDRERRLLKDAGCNLDNMPPRRHGVALRALRAGHEAGRVSVLQAPDRRDESAGTTVPARTWCNMHAPDPGDPETTLTVEATAPGDAEVQLCIDGPDDVCLDREQAAELIADLHRRFAVIIGTGETGGSRPARSWPNAVPTRHNTQVEITATTPNGNIIPLDVTDPTQALAVCLDLIADLQARLPVVIDPAGGSL